jgi:hypothetical protein
MLLKPDKRAAITALHVESAAITVCNFQVEELHCYAVGLNHILVHNNAASYWDTLSKAQRAAPLDEGMKKTLRMESYMIMGERFGTLPGQWEALKRSVHHAIPLVWAHLFPHIHPNSAGCFAAMTNQRSSIDCGKFCPRGGQPRADDD